MVADIIPVGQEHVFSASHSLQRCQAGLARPEKSQICKSAAERRNASEPLGGVSDAQKRVAEQSYLDILEQALVKSGAVYEDIPFRPSYEITGCSIAEL